MQLINPETTRQKTSVCHNMQSEQLSKIKISMVATPPRGTFCTEFLQHPLSFAWAPSSPVVAAITTVIRANIYWDLLWAGCWGMPLSESCPQGCEAVRLTLCYTHLTQEESEALEPFHRQAGPASEPKPTWPRPPPR